MNVYGNDRLDLLWNEVLSWVETPSKFFRNYSIQYFKELIKHIEQVIVDNCVNKNEKF